MASSPDNVSMALFCDFENVALGVRDAKYEKFDIKRVLERLLLKGSIVVKKAYCDWERYKAFKATMHEANFELIEIPHVRQSGKNSADIRLVVDALDLCYTKSHVNTFVIISGDSDFSPLVSKLRENAKQVIGVGVKQSTSDLLIANCDEFIFYDDLVRESQRAQAKREPKEAQPAARRSPEEERRRKEELDARRSRAIEMAVETFEALLAERGDSGKIWASVLKEAIKRRKPDFSETYYGFRAFGNLLEEAQARGLLEFGRDEKSGAYVYRSAGAANREARPIDDGPRSERPPVREATPVLPEELPEPDAAADMAAAPLVEEAASSEVVEPAPDAAVAATDKPAPRRRSRGGRERSGDRGDRTGERKRRGAPAAEPGVAPEAASPADAGMPAPALAPEPIPSPEQVTPQEVAPEAAAGGEPVVQAPAKPARARAPRKPAARRTPRKPKEPGPTGEAA